MFMIAHNDTIGMVINELKNMSLNNRTTQENSFIEEYINKIPIRCNDY